MSLPSTQTAARLLRAGFCVALLAAFTAAVVPGRDAPELLPWDKAQHFLAFYVLAVLGAAAYPRSGLLRIGTALSAFGALIEFVQMIPALHRDAEFLDWLADTIAIAAALSPLSLVTIRQWLRG
jgi:hypothetical protein